MILSQVDKSVINFKMRTHILLWPSFDHCHGWSPCVQVNENKINCSRFETLEMYNSKDKIKFFDAQFVGCCININVAKGNILRHTEFVLLWLWLIFFSYLKKTFEWSKIIFLRIFNRLIHCWAKNNIFLASGVSCEESGLMTRADPGLTSDTRSEQNTNYSGLTPHIMCI